MASAEMVKILAVMVSTRHGESVADHYVKRFRHLVPPGVEIWEVSSDGSSGRQVFPGE
jgi:hypothetical protein